MRTVVLAFRAVVRWDTFSPNRELNSVAMPASAGPPTPSAPTEARIVGPAAFADTLRDVAAASSRLMFWEKGVHLLFFLVTIAWIVATYFLPIPGLVPEELRQGFAEPAIQAALALIGWWVLWRGGRWLRAHPDHGAVRYLRSLIGIRMPVTASFADSAVSSSISLPNRILPSPDRIALERLGPIPIMDVAAVAIPLIADGTLVKRVVVVDPLGRQAGEFESLTQVPTDLRAADGKTFAVGPDNLRVSFRTNK